MCLDYGRDGNSFSFSKSWLQMECNTPIISLNMSGHEDEALCRGCGSIMVGNLSRGFTRVEVCDMGTWSIIPKVLSPGSPVHILVIRWLSTTSRCLYFAISFKITFIFLSRHWCRRCKPFLLVFSLHNPFHFTSGFNTSPPGQTHKLINWVVYSSWSCTCC